MTVRSILFNNFPTFNATQAPKPSCPIILGRGDIGGDVENLAGQLVERDEATEACLAR